MLALILVTANISLTDPIEISCNVTADSTLTIYSYECSVTLGDRQQDTLQCTIDGVSMEPCECSVAVGSVIEVIPLRLFPLCIGMCKSIGTYKAGNLLVSLPAGALVDDINVFDFAIGEHTATITVNDTLGTSDSESFNFTTGKYNGK